MRICGEVSRELPIWIIRFRAHYLNIHIHSRCFCLYSNGFTCQTSTTKDNKSSGKLKQNCKLITYVTPWSSAVESKGALVAFEGRKRVSNNVTLSDHRQVDGVMCLKLLSATSFRNLQRNERVMYKILLDATPPIPGSRIRFVTRTEKEWTFLKKPLSTLVKKRTP